MESMLSKMQSVITALSTRTPALDEVGGTGLLLAMIVSLLCALTAVKLYDWFYASRATGSNVHAGFPLLAVSITGIFICIQFSLPLSLGLLGALSIVRFRTPIKEPEEIGFIMLIIMTSIASATFNFSFLLIALLVAFAGLVAMAVLRRLTTVHSRPNMLLISLPASAYSGIASDLETRVQEDLRGVRLISVSDLDSMTNLAYRFRDMPPDALHAVRNSVLRLAPGANVTIARSD